jgi:hypothetical protein
MADDEELIPPDDPRFEGAEYISAWALIEDTLRSATWLNDKTWRWETWAERPAVWIDSKTGEESPTVWDHDHCEVCHQGFSERYDDDLREGWTIPGPAGLPESRRKPNYHWLCPDCFDQYADRMGWTGQQVGD